MNRTPDTIMDTLDGPVKCTFAHVESPGKFFIRLVDRDKYLKFVDDMYSFYSDVDDTLHLESLNTTIDRENCAVVPFEGYFVRVGNLKNRPGMALAIDLGLVISIREVPILLLAKKFSLQKFPPMAIRCSIFDVKPRGDGNNWSQDAIDVFKEEIRKGRDFEVIRRDSVMDLLDEETLAYPVELFYHKTVAEHWVARSQVKKLSLSQTLLKEKLAIPIHYVEISEFDEVNNNVEIQEESTDYEEENNEIGRVEEQSKALRQDYPPPLLPARSTFLAKCVNYRESGQLFFVPLRRWQELKVLEKSLKRFHVDEPPRKWRVNDLAIAEDEHGKCYRVKVIKQIESTHYDAYCVDHGFVLTVASNKISTIQPEISEIPVFALRGILEGVVTKKHQCKEIWNMLYRKRIEVLIKSEDRLSLPLLCQVDLYDRGISYDLATFIATTGLGISKVVKLEKSAADLFNKEAFSSNEVNVSKAEEVKFEPGKAAIPKNEVQLKPEGRYMVWLSVLTNRNEFYVQLNRDQYLKMEKDLRDIYKHEVPSSMEPGQPIIFKYKDKLIYRGFILDEKYEDEESVPIWCVDFGCRSLAKQQNIKQMPSSLLNEPEFCIKVKLENSDRISTENILSVLSKENGNEFVMNPKRYENDDCWIVQLFKKSKDGSMKNLRDLLTQKL